MTKPTRRLSPNSSASRPPTRIDPQLLRACAHQRARRCTALTVEMWDAINSAWLELSASAMARAQREEFTRFLRWVQETSPALMAPPIAPCRATTPTGSRASGVYYGARRQHRAHPRCEISPAAAGQRARRRSARLLQWSAILRSVSALTAYHWVYREREAVADCRPADPQGRAAALRRSQPVATWSRTFDYIARAYGRQGPAQRQARATRTQIENSRMDEIFQHGLHEFIENSSTTPTTARRRHRRAVSCRSALARKRHRQ